MNKFFSVLATASALAIAAASANASTLTITNITGTWSSWTGGVNTTKATNGNTAELRWGIPISSGQSGYDFTPAASPSVQTAHTPFALGTFTHHNFPIEAGSSITGAALDVTFDFYLGSDSSNVMTRTSQFVFDHFETPNADAPCADGGTVGAGVNVDGCADRVTPLTNPSSSETFTIVDGDKTLTYMFAVSGFDFGSSFWTSENKSNTAVLNAMFTLDTMVQPAPVPLPAAAGLLVAGIGALTVAGRRRRRA